MLLDFAATAYRHYYARCRIMLHEIPRRPLGERVIRRFLAIYAMSPRSAAARLPHAGSASRRRLRRRRYGDAARHARMTRNINMARKRIALTSQASHGVSAMARDIFTREASRCAPCRQQSHAPAYTREWQRLASVGHVPRRDAGPARPIAPRR